MHPARITALQEHVRQLGDDHIARHSRRFFKTGKGEYGEGDRFLGIRVPVLRKLAREYKDLPLTDTSQLLTSEFHEERLLSLLILVSVFAKGSEKEKQAVYRVYLENTRFINNWDLVDSSTQHIVGAYLWTRNRNIKTEERFLIKHYQKMPRTMLRYAIEKFPEKRRKAYLKGTI